MGKFLHVVKAIRYYMHSMVRYCDKGKVARNQSVVKAKRHEKHNVVTGEGLNSRVKTLHN